MWNCCPQNYVTMTWKKDHSLPLGLCLLSFSHLCTKKYSSSDSTWPFLAPGLCTLRCGDPGSQVGLSPVFLLLPLALSPFLDLLNHPRSLSTFPLIKSPGPRWPGHPFYSGHIVLWHMPPSLGSVLGLSPPTPICQAIVAPKDTMSHHHLAGAGVGGGCCYWHLVSGGNCAGSSGPTAEDGPAPEQSTGGFVERSGRPGLSQSAATPTPCFSFP